MSMSIGDVAQLITASLDGNRDGKVEVGELRDFLNTLQEALRDPGTADTPSPSQTLAIAESPSMLSSLANSDNPAHGLKVLLNDTLVDVARDLNLTITSIPGASYPAVAELRPGTDGSLSGEQAGMRRQITEMVVQRLASDPALPDGVSVRVENLDAVSGADRIEFGTGSGEPLVFDVITGAGILKSRIAKNYLADMQGSDVESVHARQFQLLGNIAAQLARGAETYARLTPLGGAQG